MPTYIAECPTHSSGGSSTWTRWIIDTAGTSTATVSPLLWATQPTITTGCTATAVTAHVWMLWNESAGQWIHEQRALPFVQAVQPLRAQTPEEVEHARAGAEARRARHVAAEGERQLARQRARALLREALDDRQRVELATNGCFYVEVIDGKTQERRRYRIRRGRAGNVERVDGEGNRLRRYCIHPIIECPDEDTMLTQKLWLETNEELFLRTANAS